MLHVSLLFFPIGVLVGLLNVISRLVTVSLSRERMTVGVSIVGLRVVGDNEVGEDVVGAADVGERLVGFCVGPLVSGCCVDGLKLDGLADVGFSVVGPFVVGASVVGFNVVGLPDVGPIQMMPTHKVTLLLNWREHKNIDSLPTEVGETVVGLWDLHKLLLWVLLQYAKKSRSAGQSLHCSHSV
jgi:hypothetical protein